MCTHIYKYTHFSLFFPTDKGMYRRASQRPYREGSLQSPQLVCKILVENSLCKSSLQKGLHKATIQRGLGTHIHTHLQTSVFFHTDIGHASQSTFRKGPWKAPIYRGPCKAHAEGVCKSPRGFMNPLQRGGFVHIEGSSQST